MMCHAEPATAANIASGGRFIAAVCKPYNRMGAAARLTCRLRKWLGFVKRSHKQQKQKYADLADRRAVRVLAEMVNLGTY